MDDFKNFVNNTEKILNIFDIDHTLFKTYCDVHVNERGTHKRLLTLEHHELPNYRLKPNEYFDWSEYTSSKQFMDAEPIDSILEEAKKIVSEQSRKSKSIIITARSDMDDRDLFLEKFRRHGFPIDDVFVERAGNLHENINRTIGSPSPDLMKAVILKTYLDKTTFDKVCIWEDSDKNLKTLIKVISKYPNMAYEGFLIDSEKGLIKKYYSSDLTEEIKIPTDGSLGISRKDMPQLGPKDEFLGELDKRGIKYSHEKIHPKELKASQGEFDKNAIKEIMHDEKPVKSGVITSKDNYVLDGHHRWIAKYNKNEHIDTTKVDMPILDLLHTVKGFKNTHYKDINDVGKHHRKLMDPIKRTVKESIKRKTMEL